MLDLLAGRPHELLLAEEDGEAWGRAAVVTSSTTPGTALLALYEAREDEAGDGATAELVDAAEGWARAQECERLLAPVDGSTWMAYRFRVPSLDEDPTAAERRYGWEPQHPERYLQRFRDAGYDDVLGFETLGLVFPRADGYTLVDAYEQVRPAAEAARRAGYRLEVLRDRREDVPWEELHALCSACFAENPLFEPLPLAAFRGLYEGALGAAAADFTHWLRDPAGELCAVVFAFREGESVVVKSIAVSPERRGLHLSTALIHWMLEEAVAADVHEIVSALVRRGNTSEFLTRRHRLPGVETWSHGFAVVGRELER